MNEDFINYLRTTLPPAFSRKAIATLLPGVISDKTLSNLAAIGAGPPMQHIGRKVCYDRESFLIWLSTTGGRK